MRHPVASGFRTTRPGGPGPSSSGPVCAKPSGAVLRTFLSGRTTAPSSSSSSTSVITVARHSKRLPPLPEPMPLLASALPRNANDIFYNIPGYEVDRHLTTPFRLKRSASGMGNRYEKAELVLTNALLSDLNAPKTPWIVLLRLVLTKAGTEELVEDKLKLLSVDAIEINRDVIKLSTKGWIRFHVNITNYTNAIVKSSLGVSAKVVDPTLEDFLDIFCQVSLVRKSTAPQILQQLMRKTKIPKEETRKLISDSFKEASESGILLLKQPVSLICPLGKTQITVPCRGYFCSHYTCFDGSNFLQMYSKKTDWKCPICDTMIEREELMIDSFFQEVLLAVQGKQNIKIEIDSSGAFFSTPANGTTAKISDAKSSKALDCTSDEDVQVLSSDDEEGVIVCGEKRRASTEVEPEVRIKRERIGEIVQSLVSNEPSEVQDLTNGNSIPEVPVIVTLPSILIGSPEFPIIESLIQVTKILVPTQNSGKNKTYYQSFDFTLTAQQLAELSGPDTRQMVVLQLIVINPTTDTAFSGDRNVFKIEILRINTEFVQVPIPGAIRSQCFNLDISSFLKGSTLNSLGFVANMDNIDEGDPVTLFCTVGLMYKTEVLFMRDSVHLVSPRTKLAVIGTRELLVEALDISIERGIVEGSKLPVSLKCPLTGQQMKLPCRSVYCKHYACFDGIKFLEMYEGNTRLGCPICGSRIQLDNLRIDRYFELILSSLPVGTCDLKQYEVHIDNRGSFSYSLKPPPQADSSQEAQELALLSQGEVTENLALLRSNNERIKQLRTAIDQVALAFANQQGEKVGRPSRLRRANSTTPATGAQAPGPSSSSAINLTANSSTGFIPEVWDLDP